MAAPAGAVAPASGGRRSEGAAIGGGDCTERGGKGSGGPKNCSPLHAQYGAPRTSEIISNVGLGVGNNVQHPSNLLQQTQRFTMPHCIENCDIEDCPSAWECLKFQSRESENIRFCDVCCKNVYFLETLEQVKPHAQHAHKFVVGHERFKYNDGISKCCKSSVKRSLDSGSVGRRG